MGSPSLAKISKQSGSVPIEHLRLAYDMAPKNSQEAQRIKEINKAIGKAGLTGIRLDGSPVAKLLDRREIGGEELMAAQDIELAVAAISDPVRLKPPSINRVDCGRVREEWSESTSNAVERYRAFADHWSERKGTQNDPTLEILWSAVIDQWPFYQIDAKLGLKHGKAKSVVIRGLRDYAARAGEWVDGRTAARWKAEAGQSFPSARRELSRAVWRARAGGGKS